MSVNKIEHCVFKWTIEKFSLCKTDSSYRIYTPYFKLAPDSKNQWFLVLFPSMRIAGKQGIYIYLVRYINDKGPELVSLNFKLTFCYINKQITEEVNQWQFRKGYKFISKMLISCEDLINDRKYQGDDFAILTCEMIVSPDCKSGITGNNDLSEDMQCFYEGRKLTDSSIYVLGGKFAVHKAILSARSPIFRIIFQNRNELNIAKQYPNITKKIMNQLLFFIYTGSIKVDNSIEIGLYECSKIYGVTELANMLKPSEISFRTINETDVSNFIWTITNFSTVDKNPTCCIKSNKFGSCFQDRLWLLKLHRNNCNLHLARKLQLSPNSIAISIECQGETFGNPASVDLCLLDSKNDEHNIYFGVKVFLKCSTHCLTLLDKKLIEKCLDSSKDTLRIQCKVVLATGSHVKTCLNTFSSDNSLPGSLNNYEKLSIDYLNMFQKEYLADFIIRTEEKIYKVHKSILSAHSPVFENMFDNELLENNIFLDIQTNLMDMFLHYVYSGNIISSDLEIVMKMRVLAKSFGMFKLKKYCDVLFKTLINKENVINVIHISEVNDIVKMKKLVKKFIQNNIKELEIDEKWKEFVVFNSELAFKYLYNFV